MYVGGDPTNGLVVHAYGGDLVTWVLAWSRIDRVSDLDSIQRDDDRNRRSVGWEVHDVLVRLEVGGARPIRVRAGHEHRQPRVRREHVRRIVEVP